MNDQKLVQMIVREEESVVPTLFKPVQFNIIKKIEKGKKLNENEKRYLRGRMKNKLIALHKLAGLDSEDDELANLLNSIGSYYITGLEALKHNGFGWYYDTKVIEVINTKINGKIALTNRTVKFIRVKSISKSRIIVDSKNGLKYASNEQIIKDMSFTKNEYTGMVWKQMFKRYKRMFAKGIKLKFEKDREIKPSEYLKW